MNKTRIEWCDFTANPIRYRDAAGKSVWACVKASEGCQHCYAEALAHRYQGREFTAKAMEGVTPYVDEAELRAMLSPTRLPAGSKVFVGDMTDVFGPWVPFEFIDRVFAVMALTPQHTYQVLTKRPERMREYMTWKSQTLNRQGAVQYVLDVAHARGEWGLDNSEWPKGRPRLTDNWPLPNVWLGTSVELQRWADVRIPELLACPAAVRFISAEPLLGPLDLQALNLSPAKHSLRSEVWQYVDTLTGTTTHYVHGEKTERTGPHIDWVIVGGESGPGARPMDVAWARSIVEQCQAAGVAVFVKQLGARPYVRWLETEAHPVYDEGDPGFHEIENLEAWRLRNRKGADPDEWPEDLRVREWPL